MARGSFRPAGARQAACAARGTVSRSFLPMACRSAGGMSDGRASGSAVSIANLFAISNLPQSVLIVLKGRCPTAFQGRGVKVPKYFNQRRDQPGPGADTGAG